MKGSSFINVGDREPVNHPLAEPKVAKQQAQEIVEVIYQTGSKTFYALTQKDLEQFEQEEKILNDWIGSFLKANELVAGNDRPRRLAKAKENFNAKIKPYISGPNKNDITEIVRFKGRKYTYIRSDKIKNHWRSYKLDKDMRDRSVFMHGKLDLKKLKPKLESSTELWSEDWEGGFSEWDDKLNKQFGMEKTLLGMGTK